MFDALLDAFKSLFHPRIIFLAIWPMAAAVAIWAGLAIFFWSDWATGFSRLVNNTGVQTYMDADMLAWVVKHVALLLIILFLVPLIYITALFIASIFSMPGMLNYVAARQYPEMEKKHGGTFIGSIWNAIAAILIYLVLWVATLPLWLFAVTIPLIHLALNGYLNQRLFRYDALAEHASKEEIELFRERYGWKLFLLGFLLAFTQFIPILNFFSPIYIGLAFIHYCLAMLKKMRGAGS
jgi:CysZ protein